MCIVIDPYFKVHSRVWEISDRFVKVMKNAFYFMLKALFVLKIFIFCAVAMLLIEKSWFLLILSCCVFIEIPWMTDEVWMTDKSFVVAREKKISSWSVFF